MGKDPGSEGTRGDKGRLGQRAAMADGSPQPSARQPPPRPVPSGRSRHSLCEPSSRRPNSQSGDSVSSAISAAAATTAPRRPSQAHGASGPAAAGKWRRRAGPRRPGPSAGMGGGAEGRGETGASQSWSKAFCNNLWIFIIIFFTIFFLSAVENRP